jgi:hypothetical protein
MSSKAHSARYGDSQPLTPDLIRSALVVVQPWADHLAHGRKLWELRSGPIHKRELVGLIAARTKTVIGVARLVDCIGPLSQAELEDNAHMHLVPSDHLARNPKWCWAWVMDAARLLAEPVDYVHPSGAQAWVNICATTARRIALQLDWMATMP